MRVHGIMLDSMACTVVSVDAARALVASSWRMVKR